ncbi:hypothetical protein [Arsenicibacter rosenii]|uniref:Uncharacterized protein n=1 Tax=Arsenicibacter rosenii TaxID=1750698 RepID=A0A1S2VBW1_9BACT|nr:hypothetical protein [Arsenicibacter rosenii]OIN55428.1 hypothetical protein BLX24_30950 [Arsenicibacter rosenii]
MNYLQLIINFLKGATAKFGTTTNLLREIILSVVTAVVVAVAVNSLTPTQDVVSDLKEVITVIRRNQHQADSVSYSLNLSVLHRRIDSLKTAIILQHEQDSIQYNHRLSDLDAMRRINGAIRR